MGVHYLPHEEEVIQKVFKGEITLDDAVKLIDRNRKSIIAKIFILRRSNKIKKDSRKGVPWTLKEKEELILASGDDDLIQKFAEKNGRSFNSCICQLAYLEKRGGSKESVKFLEQKKQEILISAKKRKLTRDIRQYKGFEEYVAENCRRPDYTLEKTILDIDAMRAKANQYALRQRDKSFLTPDLRTLYSEYDMLSYMCRKLKEAGDHRASQYSEDATHVYKVYTDLKHETEITREAELKKKREEELRKKKEKEKAQRKYASMLKKAEEFKKTIIS